MAEPLKNAFGPEIPTQIAQDLTAVYPKFDTSAFLDHVLIDYDELELTPRAKRVADGLAATLPQDRARAVDLITASLRPAPPAHQRAALDGFEYLPYVYFVGTYGLDAYEESMRAQYELTKRFTAEFSIRSFISAYPEATLDRLMQWTADPNEHVRRLVSEGTRPRLPWAARLPQFQTDPTPVLRLLEELKDDPSEYVRRSVANNLNDIAKDNPERVLTVAETWWSEPGAGAERKRLVRHGLRTLIKQGDPTALAIMGFSADSPAQVATLDIEPEVLEIGEKVRLKAIVTNPGSEPAGALIDFRVDFIKASGRTGAKVFKGAELELASGERRVVSKTISLAQHSTRRHFPGEHRVLVQLNGVTRAAGAFELRPPTDTEGTADEEGTTGTQSARRARGGPTT